jgi:hypothetical protein
MDIVFSSARFPLEFSTPLTASADIKNQAAFAVCRVLTYFVGAVGIRAGECSNARECDYQKKKKHNDFHIVSCVERQVVNAIITIKSVTG